MGTLSVSKCGLALGFAGARRAAGVVLKFRALIFFWNRMSSSPKLLPFGSGSLKKVHTQQQAHKLAQNKAPRGPQPRLDSLNIIGLITTLMMSGTMSMICV